MNFKLVTSFVILAILIALVRTEEANHGDNSILERLQDIPNRSLTVSEMVAILRNNPDQADAKFDPKRIFRAPAICSQGERLDSQGRCRKYSN